MISEVFPVSLIQRYSHLAIDTKCFRVICRELTRNEDFTVIAEGNVTGIK